MSGVPSGYYPDTEAGWAQLIENFESAGRMLEAAALDGAIQAAQELELSGDLTRLYDDETGATRYSTTAYAAGPGYNGDGIVDERRAGAQALFDLALARGVVTRNAFALVEEVEPSGSPAAVTIILTALMDYDEPLVLMQGGARDFISEAMLAGTGMIQDTIARALQEVLA